MANGGRRGALGSPLLAVAGLLYFLFAVVGVVTYTNASRINFKDIARTFSWRRLMRRMRGGGGGGGGGRRSRSGTGVWDPAWGPEPYRGAWGWNETEAAEAKAFEGTALITLATGDSAARHAVTLLQTLRDSGTKIPVLEVLISKGGLGSEDCHNATLRNERNAHYHCSSKHVEARDIVSQIYLDAFRRLGAKVRIIEPIEDTPYTGRIPGGRNTFWGMSFNKMRIFGYTEYRKILFIDADVLVLRNIDHVLHEPGFTAAFTMECCNRGARAKLGGGMWIFEPSAELWNRTLDLISQPCPMDLCGSEDGTWVHADMDVVNHMFCDIDEKKAYENWPFVRDTRQGVVPGLEYYPAYRQHSAADMARLTGFPESGLPAPPGLLPQYKESGGQIWRMLDSRFDGLVGTCECMPERDMPEIGYTVHFSCMKAEIMSKPGHIHSEQDLMHGLYRRAMGCTRYYLLKWYDAYKRGMQGRLPEPYYTGPPVPAHNATHDALVEVWREEDKRAREKEEADRKARGQG